MLDVPKSSYYHAVGHPLIRLEDKYKGLRNKIEAVIRKHKSYGHNRIKQDLSRKFKIIINHKPLLKLLKAWHLKRIRKVRYPKPSLLAQHIKELGGKVNLTKGLKQVKPFKVLFTDFTEIGNYHLILYSDKTSKRIIGWDISLKANTDSALRAYKRAKRYLRKMKVNLKEVVIHQDQDSVFTSYEYAGALLNDSISLSFTERGFKDNPSMESCNGHFKDEYSELIQEADDNLEKTIEITRKCINDWNRDRIHSSLNGRSPDEFLRAFYKIKRN